ncbi:MAG: hypothetical protein AW08_01765 [Candidatus Accumulibacter adjunctus]|uniref:Uncharacterized protein n=1 Tax=Candidatus Accumulibacter adjunctus TaxID=1454001 RepID=A0A011PNC3_9PROT|nr:MAG: hypothetical protein AW08_01765 [Candidatus Accumulibacter adjunctus]
MAAGASEPRYANPLANGEALDGGAFLHHHADDFVTQDERQAGLSQIPVEDMQISAADAACAHREQHLFGRGAWSGHFAQAQRRARGI